jgi:hypothetical protein
MPSWWWFRLARRSEPFGVNRRAGGVTPPLQRVAVAPGAPAFQEVDVQLALQVPHGLAQRGLRHMQLLGRPAQGTSRDTAARSTPVTRS